MPLGCLLSEAQRTFRAWATISGFDPKRAFTQTCFAVSADRICQVYRTSTGYPENLSSFGPHCSARRTGRGTRVPIASLGHLSFWSVRLPSARLLSEQLDRSPHQDC